MSRLTIHAEDAPDAPLLRTEDPAAMATELSAISLTPGHPKVEALRSRFLSEHIHTEDEVRFFVRGAGNLIMHVDGKVWDAHCTAGDLASVQANTQHWFDAGPQPEFTALRVFTDHSGWVPHCTGQHIHERFPAA